MGGAISAVDPHVPANASASLSTSPPASGWSPSPSREKDEVEARKREHHPPTPILDALASLAYTRRSRAEGHFRASEILIAKVAYMSRRCELTGVGPMVGNNVSHSNIKTKRRFLPALSPATLQSEALGQSFKLRITNAALRTLDFRGGLDVFLAKAKDEDLSPRALKIKRQLKAKLAEQAAA